MEQTHDSNSGFMLYGLAYGCPYRIRKDNCPFKEKDTSFFIEKVDWINSLVGKEKVSILNHHLVCTRSRHQERPE